MKRLFLLIFTWWNSATAGTLLWTSLFGEFVGEDEFGNRYYRRRGARSWREERRWVVYAGDAEPEGSAVPAGWNAWLHRNLEQAPSEQPLTVKRWEKPHLPNLTGTAAAYVPPGHESRGGKRAPATGDYEPWRP